MGGNEVRVVSKGLEDHSKSLALPLVIWESPECLRLSGHALTQVALGAENRLQGARVVTGS